MHKMSGSRAGSTSSKMEKRKITLTAKALASKIELIQKQRKQIKEPDIVSQGAHGG